MDSLEVTILGRQVEAGHSVVASKFHVGADVD
jgi:hypothetical protein